MQRRFKQVDVFTAEPLKGNPLAVVLDSGAGTFVGPAGKRAAEMRGEDRVRDLVRQHTGEEPVERPLDVHFLAENAAAVEGERGRSAGAAHGDRPDRADAGSSVRAGPRGHLF